MGWRRRLGADVGAGLEPFDPFNDEFREDPYPVYARYRERDPVQLGAPPMPSLPTCWYVFRHQDVWRALQDDRLGRERVRAERGQRTPLPRASTVIRRVVRRMVLFADPPRHDRLRGAMEQAWPPALDRLIEERAAELADRLFAIECRRRRPDLASGVCTPLPVLVMAEVLGVPPRDRLRLKRWSHDIVALTDVHENPEVVEPAGRATAEVVEYLRDLLATRRRVPTDDLLGRMVSVGEEEGLDPEEVLANAVLLLAAGHETTIGLLGNGLLALLQRPHVAGHLARNPGEVPRAVEEMVRYESPVQMTFRHAHEDLDIGGVTVRRGEAVALVLGSANRDGAVFEDPDEFRPDRRPNPHVGFGSGRHTCYGAALARLEAQVTFRTLLPRLAGVALDARPVKRSDNFLFRALTSLPVQVRSRTPPA